MLYAVVRLVGFEPTISRVRGERLKPLANSLVKKWRDVRESNPSRLDRQSSASPVGLHRMVEPSGFEPESSATDALSFGRWPANWYPRDDSNADSKVRSLVPCPLDDGGEKTLAGRPGLEPATSAVRARRAANCASGQWLRAEELNLESRLQRPAAYR